jgi:3',5'-cyclic AMP phosphodiesterase CpdA
MQNALNAPLTRREGLRRISAGALLALGLWPGTLRGNSGGRFRFAVVNDTHYMSEACGVWLRGVVRRIASEKPEFCLVAGDLAEQGTEGHLTAMREVLGELGIPTHVVIGNHDYATHTDRAPYERVFPNQLNYWFEHKGWQFVGLDTTQGTDYQKTKIQEPTLRWLDENLPLLDRNKPTVILTHFPLGEGVQYRPVNADALLNKLFDVNLRAVFSGHFHGFTERASYEAILTTNKCCALKRDNHDKTTEKGFFICDASGQAIERRFVQVN